MPTYILDPRRLVTTDSARYPEVFATATARLPISQFRLQPRLLTDDQPGPHTHERTFSGMYSFLPLVTTMSMRAPSGLLVIIEKLTSPTDKLLRPPGVLFDTGDGVININVSRTELLRIGVSVGDAAFAAYLANALIRHAADSWPEFAGLAYEDVEPTAELVLERLIRLNRAG